MKKWRCSVCGFVYDGEEAPESCPKCGASKEKFAEVPQDAAALIDKSRKTNQLHMELFTHLQRVLETAEAGIKDNLDPPCVKVFEYAKAQAQIIQQMVKAELAGHMNKGKWG
ncbi:MAG: rubredoxin [Firmicutes bacterium]|nr:rubredoxin [Bacillota bacterium]